MPSPVTHRLIATRSSGSRGGSTLDVSMVSSCVCRGCVCVCVRARACMVSARVRPRARFFASVSPCVPVRVRLRPHPHTQELRGHCESRRHGRRGGPARAATARAPRTPHQYLRRGAVCACVCVVVAVGEQASSREDPSRVNMYIT